MLEKPLEDPPEPWLEPRVGARPDASDGPAPAEVERLGSLFAPVCPVCPWEGSDWTTHFDALVETVQHNRAVHTGPLGEHRARDGRADAAAR